MLGGTGRKHWQYISQFGYAVGTGSYSLRLKLRDHAPNKESRGYIDAHIYLDEDWDSIENLTPCDRPSLARRTLPLTTGGDGRWGAWQNGTVYQVVRPHIWYFALSDCGGFSKNMTVLIDFEFRAQQFDGSELSLEERHMPAANGLSLVGMGTFFLRYASQCRKFRQSAGALHPVIWALTAAMGLQYLAQLLQQFHLQQYLVDGLGARGLDVLSDVLLMLAQSVRATLLVAIAHGFTLVHPSLNELGSIQSVAIPVLAFHALSVCIGQVNDNASSQRIHEYSRCSGFVLMMIRLLLFAWFARAVRSSQDRASLCLQGFLQQFQWAGSVYLLAYPVVFLVAQLLAPYIRHPFMQLMLLAMESAADLWLADMFLKRGAYFKMSTLSSPLLPSRLTSFSMGLSKLD